MSPRLKHPGYSLQWRCEEAGGISARVLLIFSQLEFFWRNSTLCKQEQDEETQSIYRLNISLTPKFFIYTNKRKICNFAQSLNEKMFKFFT